MAVSWAKLVIPPRTSSSATTQLEVRAAVHEVALGSFGLHKTNAERGGAVENIYLRNSKVKSVGNAVVHATMLYDVGRDGSICSFKNIIENCASRARHLHGGL